MNVEDRLPGGFVAIHDRPITYLGKTLVRGDRPRGAVEAADNRLIVLADVIDRRNVLAWNDQYMCRRLGVDVPKRDGRVGFVNDVCRNIPGQDFAEKAVIVSHNGLLLIHGPASEERVRERSTIDVFQLATQRHTVRDTTGLHRVLNRQFRQVM